jgi:two-component sensor histidine kinase
MDRLTESYNIRGNIYLDTKKIDKAITDCEKAKKIAVQKNILQEKEKACLCLSKAYQVKGDYKNAYLNQLAYQQANSAIFNRDNIKNLTKLQMKYNYDKKKEHEKLVAAVKEKETKNTINILVLGLISLFFIVGLLFRYNQIRKKNNEELLKKNTKIVETLNENQALIKETHHRVKNNLQIVNSLLNMQLNFLGDEKSKNIIKNSQNRIRSMSLIHQQLYKGNNLSNIETKTYFNKLIDEIISSYGINRADIKQKIDIENMLLNMDTAIPLGLIVNELVTNVFKHSKNNKEMLLSLSFKHIDKQFLRLSVKDNGQGIPSGFDITKSNSYGIKLIMMLLNKLKATINFTNDNGLIVDVDIYEYKIATQ